MEPKLKVVDLTYFTRDIMHNTLGKLTAIERNNSMTIIDKNECFNKTISKQHSKLYSRTVVL